MMWQMMTDIRKIEVRFRHTLVHNVVWLIILWAVQYLQACAARLMSSFSGYKDRNELWAQTPPSKHGALIWWWAIPNDTDDDDDEVTLECVTSDWCLGRITGNWVTVSYSTNLDSEPWAELAATGTWPGCAGRRQSRDFRPEQRHRAPETRWWPGAGTGPNVRHRTGARFPCDEGDNIPLHNGRWAGH